MEYLLASLQEVVALAVIGKAFLDRLPNEVVAVGTVGSFLLNFVDGTRRAVCLLALLCSAVISKFRGPKN